MESQINKAPLESEELSLKDLILKLQAWKKYILGKWLVFLIAGIIGAALGLGYAMFETPRYSAKLTFVLEDPKSSSLGAYAGLASQFGIDLGGSSGSGIFSGDNIVEFLKSRLMIEKTLLSPVITPKGPKSIADLYMEVYGLHDKWKKSETLRNISFPLTTPRSKFSLVQDSVLFVLYDRILKKNLDVSKPDKALSFINVKCVSEDQLFSKVFTEYLVKLATDFYVDTKTQRSKATMDKLQAKADSIEFMLNRQTYSVARTQDLNLNPARSIAGVATELASRDKMVLQTMYAEVIKNLEVSKIALAQETPIIQVVDVPILPLEKMRLGKVKGVLIGGILAGFLVLIWVIIARVFSEIMAPKKQEAIQ